MTPISRLGGHLGSVAVVVARHGRLPGGADEAVTEAGGRAVVVGSGAGEAAAALTSATEVWAADTDTDPAGLAGRIGPVLADVDLVVLPASPDGRDLAPRLATVMGRPLLAGVTRAERREPGVSADLLRCDGRVTVTVTVAGPAVATLWPGSRSTRSVPPPEVGRLDLGAASGPSSGVVSIGLIEPDPATMDLAEAGAVLGGGAGLVAPGTGDGPARAVFDLLVEVAAALGASAGATRVVTDAGWMAPERQIGTTGVTLHPDVYVAFGVSGATQHTGGLGDPARIVSINRDPACPMTAMADLGLVVDAPALLLELAARLGIEPPAALLAGSRT